MRNGLPWEFMVMNKLLWNMQWCRLMSNNERHMHESYMRSFSVTEVKKFDEYSKLSRCVIKLTWRHMTRNLTHSYAEICFERHWTGRTTFSNSVRHVHAEVECSHANYSHLMTNLLKWLLTLWYLCNWNWAVLAWWNCDIIQTMTSLGLFLYGDLAMAYDVMEYNERSICLFQNRQPGSERDARNKAVLWYIYVYMCVCVCRLMESTTTMCFNIPQQYTKQHE